MPSPHVRLIASAALFTSLALMAAAGCANSDLGNDTEPDGQGGTGGAGGSGAASSTASSGTSASSSSSSSSSASAGGGGAGGDGGAGGEGAGSTTSSASSSSSTSASSSSSTAASSSSTGGVSTSCDGSVVISQVYGGGGFESDGYKKDYVELHNRGTTAVSLEGWSIQQAGATGTTFIPSPLSGSIEPGGYFLIIGQGDKSLGKALPAGDVTNANFNMSVKGAKIALVKGKTDKLSGGCPTSDSHVVDFVGFGNANCKLGGGAAPAHSNTTATLRNAGGCVDTADNKDDFAFDTPNPRNSVSAKLDCDCE